MMRSNQTRICGFNSDTPQWRVAESLRALEYRVSYVGNDQQPPRGSTDEDVLDPARKPNQVVVTSNHDMIMLCAEVGESGIWLDPRGRQLRREEHVVLAFTNIVEWQLLLRQASAPVCVRALRARRRRRTRSTPSHDTYPLAHPFVGMGNYGSDATDRAPHLTCHTDSGRPRRRARRDSRTVCVGSNPAGGAAVGIVIVANQRPVL